MLEELFGTLLFFGIIIAVFHLLGRWSPKLKTRPIAQLFTAIFLGLAIFFLIILAIG